MKIILWDIETAPLLVTSWGIYDQRLSHDNIVEDASIICGAWKVLGEKQVQAVAIDPKYPRNDRKVVLALRNILAAADVIVGHNGDEFDLKTLNARLAHHGLAPLPPLKTIDTLKVAKKQFRFVSNRLDYLGQFLGVGRKIHTDYSLWLSIVLQNDPAALKTMVKYNKQDVLLLEQVYLKLRPFMPNHPNHRLCDGNVCPICGATGSLHRRGWRMARKTRARAYQCQACGGWSSGKNEERTEIA